MVDARYRTRARMRPALMALALTLAGAAVAACGASGPSATSAGGSVSTAPVGASAATSSGTGADMASVCRHLQNLKSLDYAFGASFSIVQALDSASKAMTLKDLQAFAAEAPAELQTAVTDLTAFWTALAADPNSVTESDPRLVGATATLGAWLAAHCA